MKTHTYAILEVSSAVYAEIRAKLVAAGYHHALHKDDDGEAIDMYGIALREAGPDSAIERILVACEQADGRLIKRAPNEE